MKKNNEETVTMEALTAGPLSTTVPTRMTALMESEIQELAANEGRSASAWIRFHLAKIIVAERAKTRRE